MCMYLVTAFVNIPLFSHLHSYRSLIVLHSSTSPMRDLFHTENVIFLMRYLFSSYILLRCICMPVVCHYREFSHHVYTSVMFFINIQQCMLLAITSYNTVRSTIQFNMHSNLSHTCTCIVYSECLVTEVFQILLCILVVLMSCSTIHKMYMHTRIYTSYRYLYSSW